MNPNEMSAFERRSRVLELRSTELGWLCVMMVAVLAVIMIVAYVTPGPLQAVFGLVTLIGAVVFGIDRVRRCRRERLDFE